MLYTPRFRERPLVAALPLLLLIACAGDPSIQTGDDAEVIMGTLNKVDNARAELAYVDPTADYGRYRKVHIQPLDLDNVEIIQPSSGNSQVNRYNREWELTDSDKQRLQDAFLQAMEKELTAGGAFELAEAGGDDVITIEAMITSIAPSAPKDDQMSRTSARSQVYTQGGGGISIAIMLSDGDSGEVLAIIKDTRNSNTGGSYWGVNNSVTNMAEVRRDFSVWAKRMHDGLLALRARAQS